MPVPVTIKDIKSGQSYVLQVELSDTTGDVKQKLQDQEGIPPDVQRLVFRGKTMKDEQTLSELGVMKESTLHVVMKLKSSIVIDFRAMTGRTVTFEVEPTAKAGDVKKMIEELIRLPADKHCLNFEGKRLADHQALGFCKVHNKATMHIILQPLPVDYTGEEDPLGDMLRTAIRLNHPLDGKDEVMKAFNEFDKDQNGTISEEELVSAFLKLDPQMAREDVVGLLRKADLDHNGVLDFNEFMSWLYKGKKDEDEDNERLRIYGDLGTLYARCGGIFGIASFVDRCMDKWMADDHLNSNAAVANWHERAQRCGFKFLVTQLMGYITGGPQRYTGRSMVEAHKHLNICGEEWDSFMTIFRGVCAEFNLPRADADDLVAILLSMEDDCVVQPGEEVPSNPGKSVVGKTLYARLGGVYPIALFADRLVDALLKDDRVHIPIDGQKRNEASLKYLFTEAVCHLCGGPEVMTAHLRSETKLLLPGDEVFFFVWAVKAAADHWPVELGRELMEALYIRQDLILDPTTDAPEPMDPYDVQQLKIVQERSGKRIDVLWGGVTMDIEGAEMNSGGGTVQLKKGDTFSKKLGKVVLEEYWSFEGSQKQYLDATCFIYDNCFRELGHLDYSKKSDPTIATHGHLNHSGDKMGHQCGHHTIEIDTCQLPSKVQFMVFTCSKYSAGTLSSILCPSATLFDGRSKKKLCTYEFDATDPAYEANTACIMCALFRVGEKWALQAVGELSQGRAGSDEAYRPLRERIEHLLPTFQVEEKPKIDLSVDDGDCDCFSLLAKLGYNLTKTATVKSVGEAAAGNMLSSAAIAARHAAPGAFIAGKRRVYGDPRTLYGKGGGVFGLARLADRLMEKWMANPSLNANQAVARWNESEQKCGFKFLVTQIMGYLTGGPQRYTGKPMDIAHKHLSITAPQWDVFMTDASSIFRKFNLNYETQQELNSILNSFKSQCILADGERAPPDPGRSKPTGDSLYAVLGGVYPIAQFVDKLVDTVLLPGSPVYVASDTIDDLRGKRHPPGLKYILTELVCNGCGGPEIVTSRGFDDAKLAVKEDDWLNFLKLAEAAAIEIWPDPGFYAPLMGIVQELKVEICVGVVAEGPPPSQQVAIAGFSHFDALSALGQCDGSVQKALELLSSGWKPSVSVPGATSSGCPFAKEHGNSTGNATSESGSSQTRPRGGRAVKVLGSALQMKLDDLLVEDSELCCPITLLLLNEPVKASDGFTYEYEALDKRLKSSNPDDQISPMTLEKLEPTFTAEDDKKIQVTAFRISRTEELVAFAEESMAVDMSMADQALRRAAIYLNAGVENMVPALGQKVRSLLEMVAGSA